MAIYDKNMESRTRIIPVKVNDDITVMIEAKDLGGEQDVSTLSFQEVTDTIEAVTQAIATSINKVKPDKATVYFVNGFYPTRINKYS